MHHLVIKDLSAHYGTVQVLDTVNLDIARGEVIGLMGPSGSGKSSILRVLTGLTPLSAGSVSLNGEVIDYGNAQSVRNMRERSAIVFQQYNLFQNMTALENVTIAPVKIRNRNPKEVEAEASELLAKVGLKDQMSRYPDQLSGGQQQRVAIARALALKPEILLLDEITAALDPELVSEVLDTIRSLASEGMTMIIVSHEMGFMREVSHRIAFMAQGKIIECGPAEQIFNAPIEARTRDFVSKILKH
ncbi:MAG: amino acid ABC transporter ATP-binding protein [Hyphomicrobiales bacterium]|nr:amino acid ABC transporter ATP-binding protein [Hyphomicrobiales bacterium]NBS00978.1 amino acid ABC transporter ATP-binding protein [Hyphomicrobiales bacterium]